MHDVKIGRPHPGKRSSGTRPPAPGPSFARLPLLRSRRTRAALPASSILLIAVLGAAHILVRTSTYGAAVEWDSVAYLTVAESLAAGDGLTRRPGAGAFVQWPPLFPMLLALLVPFGLEPVDSARFVNILAFGLTIALAGFWLGRNLDSRLLALAGTVAVATAVPLCDIFSYVMTEPLFILFTLLALTGLESFLNRTDAAMPALALAAGWAALAAVTRYLGVVVILVGVLLVFLAPTRRDLSAAARLKHAAVYGAISSFPLVLVLARNWSVSGTLAGGYKGGPEQSLFDSLGKVGEIFWQWISMSTNAPNEALVWALVVLGSLVVVCFCHAPPRGWRASLPVLGTFATVYPAFLLVMVLPTTISQPIHGRFLTPLYVPILLMAAFLLDRLLHREARSGMAVFKWALASLLLMGGLANVGLHALTNYELTARALERGYMDNRRLVPGDTQGGSTFNTVYWDESEIVGYVKANPNMGSLYYSNIANVLTWLTDVPAVRWIGSPEVVSRADVDNLHIVWHCNPGGCPDGTPGLEVVAELSDGLVFRRSADQGPGRGAYFVSSLVPRVGEAFYSSLSLGIRIRGFTDRSPWQWEKGSDADGWTAIPGSVRPTYRYIPTAADVGHRLRAHVYYTDSDGTRRMAVTEPSEPVEGAKPD